MTFTDAERVLLAQLADVLIPAGDGYPAAGAAQVAHAGLDAVLSVRPELGPALKRLLAMASSDSPDGLIQRLPQSDPDAFAALTESVAGAYFLNAQVRAQLGYAGQQARPIVPAQDYLEEGMLQSVIDRGPVFRPTPSSVSSPEARANCIDRYEATESYDWNFDHAPTAGTTSHPAVPGQWDYCGLPIGSPLAIAAGPLLNGRWILYYASLGFDALTYKTVRSRARRAYAMPNLQPVAGQALHYSLGSTNVRADMQGSWAVSFGMPSKSPAFWRADIAATRKMLAPDKVLAVSVVATPEPTWTIDDVAKDFALCAAWAIDSGADCVEANFSCPNVASADGQLYQRPDLAAQVAAKIRAAVGRRPLLLKIGHVTDEAMAEQLCVAVAPFVNGLVMVNCVSSVVLDERGQPMFENQKRGIAGGAIRDAALQQIDLFRGIIQRKSLPLRLIGVGGISGADDVRAHLAAGCDCVQLATAAMLYPGVGQQIRQALTQASSAVRTGNS